MASFLSRFPRLEIGPSAPAVRSRMCCVQKNFRNYTRPNSHDIQKYTAVKLKQHPCYQNARGENPNCKISQKHLVTKFQEPAPSEMDALDAENRRSLGKTGIKVSPLGFGASPLGNEFGEISETAGIDAVHSAIQHNINYFDVSPYYGRTRAETVLGKALKTIPREKFVLSTKVGRYDKQVFDFSARRVRDSVRESMARLCVDFVDIVFVHDAEFGDLDLIATETIPALVKLREEGVIRAVGVSGYPLEIFSYLLMCCPPGSIDVILSYCNYSLQNDRLKHLLPGLRRDGIGVINASPLCMGLLTPSGGPDWHPADVDTKHAARKAAQVSQGYGRGIADVAIEFALAGDVDCTLVGIDSVDTLEKNLKILRKAGGGLMGVEEIMRCFDGVRGRRWESGYFKGFP